MSNRSYVYNTMIPGGAISSVLSYAVNESVFWSILHMFTGWVYTVYWICNYSPIPQMIRDWIVRSAF